jgi:hypothetical protein
MTHAPDVSARFTCRSCGQSPCVNPTFCAACDREERQHPRRESARVQRVRRLLADNVSLERAYAEFSDPRNRPTPEVTIEAVVLSVRERGIAALKEPANVERLARCDAAAKAQIDQRIKKLVEKRGFHD